MEKTKGMGNTKKIVDKNLRLVQRGRGWVPVYWVDKAHQWQVNLVSGGGYGSPSWDDIEEVARIWGAQVRDEKGEIVRGYKQARYWLDNPFFTDKDCNRLDERLGPRDPFAWARTWLA